MIALALVANTVAFFLILLFLIRCRFFTIYSGLFVYLAFHFIVFVQRPVVVYLFDLRSQYLYMRYMPTDEVFVETMLASNIGLLSFVLGYLVAIGFAPLRPSFMLPQVSPVQRNAFGLSLLLLSPLMLYSFFLAFTLRQGYGSDVLSELGQLNLRIDPETGSRLYVDNTAYIIGARNMALPFATFFVVLKRGKWWSYLPLVLCALVDLQLGERWAIVVSALVICLMALYFRGRTQFTVPQYAMMALVLVAFIALGQNRDAIVKFILTGEFDLGFDLRSSSLGDHPDFANFEFLNYVIGKVPDVSGTYSYFTQYLGVFTQPIPRALWPEKPVGSPVVLVNLDAYGNFAGMTTSLVGDGWISLGYIGIVITTGLAGAFYGWLFKRFTARTVSVYYFCAYFWMVALLLQWARDGGYRILDFFFFCLFGIALALGFEHTLLRIGGPAPPALRASAGSALLRPPSIQGGRE